MTPKSAPGHKPRPRLVPPPWIGEFGLIRTAVLTAVACVVLCLVAVLASRWQLQHADDRMEQAQRVRDTAYAQYLQVDQEKRDIQSFQPRYIRLAQRGLVGAERRLEWVDAIRRAQELGKLPPLSYEIEPRQAVRLDAAVDLGDYQLHGSRMRLHMELLHEEDLFNFLDQLRVSGFFAVQNCAVQRLGRDAGGGPALGADCTLNWVSLDEEAPRPELKKGQP